MNDEHAAEGLTHLDERGRARMVGVGVKPETERGARAVSEVRMAPEAFELVRASSGAKGDALQVARIAAIGAAKRCSDLIPLCHPVRLTSVQVEMTLIEDEYTVCIEVLAEAVDRTGVEMEAMTAAAVGALTLYDMIKSVDRTAHVTSVRLLEKWGGRSGHFVVGKRA